SFRENYNIYLQANASKNLNINSTRSYQCVFFCDGGGSACSLDSEYTPLHYSTQSHLPLFTATAGTTSTLTDLRKLNFSGARWQKRPIKNADLNCQNQTM
ncbi:hypothetical protein, partial [Lacticaseibacillus manihotivorans]|uniref:hypothetical protein n=1 Tax=Lacticaseibacillus manihotivorans TaxID=88233 RepID=UPI001F1C42F4